MNLPAPTFQQNVIQTNTGGVDENKSVYVEITNRERKTLGKKKEEIISIQQKHPALEPIT